MNPIKLWRTSFLLMMAMIACVPPPGMNGREEKTGDMTIKGEYTKEDIDYFSGFRKNISEAIRNKDVEKAFLYYSEGFSSDTGVKLSELKKNTVLLYKVYEQINYSILDFSVNVKGGTAVSTDRFTYSASPVNLSYKPLDYQGKERIYWQKENGVWKIVNWIYE
ncbi:MAG: hypothetical protein PHF84_00460 [bacterium]|nr:hypothetical protein [bacterium]